MILGIGVDLCAIARIETLCAVAAKEAQFRKRLLAEGETCKEGAAALAKRYAAKEAASKALGTGIGGALSFQDIYLSHHESGQPFLTLSAKAQAHFGADIKLHLSLSDDAGLAMAYVVAERIALRGEEQSGTGHALC